MAPLPVVVALPKVSEGVDLFATLFEQTEAAEPEKRRLAFLGMAKFFAQEAEKGPFSSVSADKIESVIEAYIKHFNEAQPEVRLLLSASGPSCSHFPFS